MMDRDYSRLLLRRGQIELWPDSPRRAEFLAAADKALDAMEARIRAAMLRAAAPRKYTTLEWACWRWFKLWNGSVA